VVDQETKALPALTDPPTPGTVKPAAKAKKAKPKKKAASKAAAAERA